jgi:outer membrane immunogenic protein
MQKYLLSGVAFIALAAGQAMAADLPARVPVRQAAPPPAVYAYNWSGFYVGGHGGGGWSDKCFTFAGAGDGCHDGDGWLGGGQVGYNWQTGQFVFGVEFSGSWADIAGSHPAVLVPADSYSSEVNTILMLTGRVGLSFDRVLAYVTGGGAWVRDRFEYTQAGVGTASARENRTGWTVGAGLEFAITPNWSLGAQYNYVDLGDRNTAFSGGGVAPFTDNVDQQLHLATVRLNYRFGGPVVARY